MNIYLYHTQELHRRWNSTTFGPWDSLWVKLVTYQLKSGLYKIKMRKELLQRVVVKLDYFKKNKKLIKKLISNMLQITAKFSKDWELRQSPVRILWNSLLTQLDSGSSLVSQWSTWFKRLPKKIKLITMLHQFRVTTKLMRLKLMSHLRKH